MSNYNSVTPEFIDELKTLLGEKYVKTDADTLDRYKTDEEADERCFHLPDVVVIPANAEEIAGVVKLCNKYLIPLTVRGGGTGIVDGAIADKGGVVLLMERLNKIIELNKEGLYMIAQAGVRTLDIQAAAKAENLLYAGDQRQLPNRRQPGDECRRHQGCALWRNAQPGLRCADCYALRRYC